MTRQRQGPEHQSGTSTPARLLHYGWPVVLAWAVAEVAGRGTGLPVSAPGRGLLLLGVGAAYTFDRLVDPPEAAGVPLRAVLGGTFAVCALGGLALLPRLPLATLALLPLLSGAVLLYRWAKAYPLVKAALVPLAWTWAGLALPLADGSWFGWRALVHPVALPLFLLMASGCLLCDVNDAGRDSARGVCSLPVQIGVRPALGLAALLALSGLGAALVLGRPGLAVDGLMLAALAGCRPLLMLESWGPLAVDVVLTVPGLLIVAHWV